jgi:hypothetical protein
MRGRMLTVLLAFCAISAQASVTVGSPDAASMDPFCAS